MSKTLKAADYYEPLLKARFVKGMQTLRTRVSTDAIASAIASGSRTQKVLDPHLISAALKPTAKVVTDAFNHGGKLAAEIVNG